MTDNVFVFVPNLIGYARILLLLYACWYMTTNFSRTVISYLLSSLLDAFDGYAARLLNQSTKFGAMLDMLSDRCATMCLLFALSTFYPRYIFLFQLSALVDIASHWLHMHVSIQSGSSSHKTIGLQGNRFLRIYYTSRPILFFMCAGNELFYSMLYALHFTDGPQMFGYSLFKVILFLSLPVALLKTFISLIHLYAASVNLAGVDVAERKKAAAAAS
ncbi:hypothetical protein SprV_0401606200 [Sparganum proliferum]